MNGFHDLGGLTCFGPVLREENEPLFHEPWERRVFAMTMLSPPLGPIDAFRHAIERMDAAHYLDSTYYEHWLQGLETRVEDRQLEQQPAGDEPVSVEMVNAVVPAGSPSEREASDVPVRFKVGDTVRVKNMNPRGHTRLPRYVRGHIGTISMLHGNHVYPDTAAHDQGEHPQPLYNVCFKATELWGADAPERDCLYIDLWDSYLEAVA